AGYQTTSSAMCTKTRAKNPNVVYRSGRASTARQSTCDKDTERASANKFQIGVTQTRTVSYQVQAVYFGRDGFSPRAITTIVASKTAPTKTEITNIARCFESNFFPATRSITPIAYLVSTRPNDGHRT